MHNNIQYGGKPLRNLCPAKGGSQLYGPEMYFLSNRNFTTGNDTIFLVKINDTINAPNQTVTVTLLLEIQHTICLLMLHNRTLIYLPPTMRVYWGHLSRTIKYNLHQIHLTPHLVLMAFFHGVISSASTAPSLASAKYSNVNFDFGYPNISYAGSGPNDDRSIISLLFSSPTVLPGFGAILFDGINDYSPITNIKDGLGYVNMLNGNER
ncbi:MAG: hypothetical protein IPP29_13020 [Bacteroidetes bacterium]|nr:hypothetical protein [Bacteroidota bacterium]